MAARANPSRGRASLAVRPCATLTAMGRRSDPERIFAAQHHGVRNRLIGDGMQPETADRWLDA